MSETWEGNQMLTFYLKVLSVKNGDYLYPVNIVLLSKCYTHMMIKWCLQTVTRWILKAYKSKEKYVYKDIYKYSIWVG